MKNIEKILFLRDENSKINENFFQKLGNNSTVCINRDMNSITIELGYASKVIFNFEQAKILLAYLKNLFEGDEK
jgi:hypothetical protein